jgi:hypothetical protein
MDGLLNERTDTVHRFETEEPDLRTACGASRTLDTDQLRRISLERAAADDAIDKCGRCFEEGGGY